MRHETKRITRYGAYGIIFHEAKLLLIQKKSGPHKGLWDLPGGGIEFGESPEDACKRELIEEVGLQAHGLELWNIKSVINEFSGDNGEKAILHHIGVLYKVVKHTPVTHVIPEEKHQWFLPSELSQNQLTPFANLVF